VSTFDVLVKCLPCLAFVGLGLYFLLTALVPSGREKDWRHWKFYGLGESNRPTNPNSWLVQLGFVKLRKPVAEGDFDEKSAVLLYYVFAALFLFIGIGGLILITYLSVRD
jgi:hypothetical protein